MLHIQRYLLTGVLTVIPIWITWVVFEFFLQQLSQLGMPLAHLLSNLSHNQHPAISSWLLEPWLQSSIAITLTLLALYLLGWASSRVIGGRLVSLFDRLMNRIPVVQTIYGSVRKLISVLQTKPDNIQRVVLINFPNPEMRTVGFVTRVFADYQSGEQLAAVYVPTTPNPTSGYMEIVPLDSLTSTDWSMDEAMTFVMSAGAIAPEKISFHSSGNNSDKEN
ncbi:MAG: DUF502 domain-containing protein [Gammaproteobacteria bacterium]|nr:DUF502 domain-containing protein [Gammaproteobacteria bacterium]